MNIHNDMKASQKHTMLVKEVRESSLKSLQADSIFMTFSQKPNHRNRRQTGICLGQQEGIGFKEALRGNGSVFYLACGGG